ncbi:unnamed protein product [Closterium sp. NIES-53]
MNEQIANGHHPIGLSAPDVPRAAGSSAQTPRAGLSRVWRESTRGATSHPVEDEIEEDKPDSEYRAYAVGTDDDEDDDEESEEEEGEDDDDDVAEEEAQPMTPLSRRAASKTTSSLKRKGKAPVKEPF